MKRLPSGDTFVVDFDAKCNCGNHATHLITSHAIDQCTPEEPTITEFMCNTCLSRLYKLVALLVEENARCNSCLLSFVNQCDIIVSLWPIPKEGK